MDKKLNIGTIKILTVVGLLLGFVVIFLGFNDKGADVASKNTPFEIVQKWELPPILREISAITWLGDDKIAAVQDEEGIIFIFDLKSNKITDEVKFAGPGDYEGLTVHGKDAYVLRSDGTIFEVKNFKSKKPKVMVYNTPFSTKNNMETLVFDESRNSLLLAPKDRTMEADDYKGIYAFSLDTKELSEEPILKIYFNDEMLKPFEHKQDYKTFRPSGMAIHPKTKDLYILEGTRPKLLIMKSNGDIKGVFPLSRRQFPQPEGITFSEEGVLYISTEGKKNSYGMIYEANLK
ncbi:MAG: SdiA-regulated domain-containing protein [Arenibacter latericius]|nr:SdiA-regulated domain-containing protein [Arenibacter latericius]